MTALQEEYRFYSDPAVRRGTAATAPLIVAGEQRVSPLSARLILDRCSLEIQEHRTKTGAFRIDHWGNMIDRGGWIPNSQIHFAQLPDLTLYLLNGYHRLHATAAGKTSLSYHVVIIGCSDMGEVLANYAKFDRKTEIRPRSDSEVIVAFGLAEEMRLKGNTMRGLWRAVGVIDNGMSHLRATDLESRHRIAIHEVRADLCRDWKSEMADYVSCIEPSWGTLRLRLLRPSTVAVALQTIRYQRDKAMAFWSTVARNDGLKVGTPTHTLVRSLLDRRFAAGQDENLILPALAWNAYFENRTLGALKTGATNKLRIVGTPIGK